MVSTSPRLEMRRCAWAVVQPRGVRGNRNLSRERCKACVDSLSCSPYVKHLWDLKPLPVVASSSKSKLHSSSSTAGMVFGAGCTHVGTWLVLGNSRTRLSGSSSSLYVHANWDRMTRMSLGWNKHTHTKKTN